MKQRRLAIILCSIVIVHLTVIAQNPSFDINVYKTYLKNHEHTTPPALMAEYPAPMLQAKAGNTGSILFLDSVRNKLLLTQNELDMMNQNGFVVSERMKEYDFLSAFLKIWIKDLPLFISTDAILHAVHRSYDNILKETELKITIPQLTQALDDMINALPSLKTTYPEPEMAKCINDLDVYLTIAKTLLEGKWVGYPRFNENALQVDMMLNNIKLEHPMSVPFMMETARTFDFSQFTVRGHYTDNSHTVLAKYFRAMMWLGRTEFLFSIPVQQGSPVPTDADIQRQIIDAFLFNELARSTSARSKLDQIDVIITSLVGEQDNITSFNLDDLAKDIGLLHANELLIPARLQNLNNALITKSYAIQRINSQILTSDPMSPDQIQSPSAFLPLGQRFIIDSYITGNVVYDKIIKDGHKIFRGLPSSLDVLFALGNNASAQLLQPDLTTYSYAPNLSALRFLIDSYDTSYWNGSLYKTWLRAIRSLNIPQQVDDFPSTMQTAAFWQQKMNTQLSSWAELRHDNLLYAKQSYTGGNSCSYPLVYVEPFPEFYGSISRFASNASLFYSDLSQSTGINLGSITNYFDSLAYNTNQLQKIAFKEKSLQTLDSSEISFLQRTYFYQSCPSGGPIIYGWYPRMYYMDDRVDQSTVVVADVHTQPTDEGGYPIGKVLHVGTGFPNLGIFVLPTKDGSLAAYVGVFNSYHEYVTTQFKRLTDEEWPNYLNDGSAQRPDFVNIYLADSNGMHRPQGRELFKDSLGIKIKKPHVVLFSTSIDFQKVEIDSQKTLSVSIFNAGNIGLDILNPDIRGANASSFQIVNLLHTLIQPLSVDSIQIQYSPQSIIPEQAELVFQTNDPYTPEVVISLNGCGIVLKKPQMVVSTLTLDFGPVDCDSIVTKGIVFQNSGDGNLILTNGRIQGQDATVFKVITQFPVVLHPNSSSAFVIQFSPKIPSYTEAEFVFNSNDESKTEISISLIGTGYSLNKPKISLSSTSIDFGSVVRDSSLTKSILISNYGKSILQLNSIAFRDSNNQSFKMLSVSQTIDTNQTKELKIEFKPTSVGNFNNELIIESNDPLTPTVAIGVIGSSHVPALPSLKLSASTLNFSEVELGWNKEAALKINNDGNGTLLITDQQIRGVDSSNFSIVTPFRKNISPNDSSQLTIRFTANNKSSPKAFLQIISNDPQHSLIDIPLTAQITTDVNQPSNLSATFSINQNYPNPFSQISSIRYQLVATNPVRIKVFDIFGREVATLLDEEKSAGNYEMKIDASNLPAGIYFYRIDTGKFTKVMKMNVVK